MKHKIQTQGGNKMNAGYLKLVVKQWKIIGCVASAKKVYKDYKKAGGKAKFENI